MPQDPALISTAATSSSTGRRRLRFEVLIVLGLSLGQSAVYAIVQLIDKLTAGPLAQQTSTLNPSQSTREYLDLTYQLLGIGFSLVPVLLVLFLLSGRTGGERNPLRLLGIDGRRPWHDLGWGTGLFVVIAAGSLGLYQVGRAWGITTAIVPAALNTYWWTVPVLVLSAVRHALLEEIIVVGYLTDRLRRLGWPTVSIVVGSAVLRGSYHLYQGIGPFVGNVVMGLIFMAVYLRVRRVAPLIITHALLDIGAFVGFTLFGRAIGLG